MNILWGPKEVIELSLNFYLFSHGLEKIIFVENVLWLLEIQFHYLVRPFVYKVHTVFQQEKMKVPI